MLNASFSRSGSVVFANDCSLCVVLGYGTLMRRRPLQQEEFGGPG